MPKSIQVKWNDTAKDYELTKESKGVLKSLPSNISRSIINQLRQATEFTRKGLMNKVTEVSYGS